MRRIWDCKVGFTDDVPEGSDQVMRQAVRQAYIELTGKYPNFIFSGWGGELTQVEAEELSIDDPAPESEH